MAAQAVQEPTGKKIGTTTMGATAGTGLAGAAAVVLVWVIAQAGVDVPAEVSAAPKRDAASSREPVVIVLSGRVVVEMRRGGEGRTRVPVEGSGSDR